MDRGCPASRELPVLSRQGRRRPDGPGLHPDPRAERQHHAVLHTHYGPYQFPEKIIPLFVTNLLDGLKVPLYGDGGNVRDWIHVDDHCRGIQLVLEQGTAAGVYHINGDAELTNLELTRVILEQCGAGWDRVTRWRTARAMTGVYSLDDRALRALGYAPRIPFAEGLAATVAWYADHTAPGGSR